MYDSIIAIAYQPSGKVELWNEDVAGFGWTHHTSVSVSDPKNVALYGSVLAAQEDSYVHFFEKIGGTWTATKSYSGSSLTNVAMYSNTVVVGGSGEYC